MTARRRRPDVGLEAGRALGMNVVDAALLGQDEAQSGEVGSIIGLGDLLCPANQPDKLAELLHSAGEFTRAAAERLAVRLTRRPFWVDAKTGEALAQLGVHVPTGKAAAPHQRRSGLRALNPHEPDEHLGRAMAPRRWH